MKDETRENVTKDTKTTPTEKTGKFLAYVLRHDPHCIGVEMDEHGWVDVDELVAAANKTGRTIDAATVEQTVANDTKRRFSFCADKSKIRANQGHSVAVDPDLKEVVPPDILYHGTAKANVASILERGINSAKRNFVHLSKDEQTALNVGARHGEPTVLTIKCAQMSVDGYKFFLSENGVYLTEFVPREYIIGAKNE